MIGDGEDEFDQERQQKLLEEIDVAQCRGIWAAVLIQTCIDARSKGGGRDVIKARAEALAWFADNDEDSEFALVCELAGIDPRRFKRNIRKFLDPQGGLDFRCSRRPSPQKRVRAKDTLTNQGENNDEQQSTYQDRARGEHSCRDLGQHGRG